MNGHASSHPRLIVICAVSLILLVPSAWWVLTKDTCAFYATGQVTVPAPDAAKIRAAIDGIPGVFSSSCSISGSKIEISGTISTPRWWSKPEPEIKRTLENLGLGSVLVSGYY